MSLEVAKMLLVNALAIGDEAVRALALSVLEQLESAEERARRLARKRQQVHRGKRDAGVTAPSDRAPSGHAPVTLPEKAPVTPQARGAPEIPALSAIRGHAGVTLAGEDLGSGFSDLPILEETKIPDARESGVTEARRDRDEPEWHRALRAVARRSHSRTGGAAQLHDVFEAALRAEGFDVARELPVEYPDGSDGRVDLVAKWEATTLVLELDNLTPRGRSVLKMQQFKGAVTVSVLRTAALGWAEGKPWADIVIGLAWRSAIRSVANSSDDGAFGMTVEAWCEGISSVTGRPTTRPTHGQQRQLVQAQTTHRMREAPNADPVAWSRDSAAEYARSYAGRILSTFEYVRWIDSNRPSGTVLKARAVDEENPYARQKQVRAEQNAERERHEARLLKEAAEGAARAAAKAGAK
jgi:hypothetical protein